MEDKNQTEIIYPEPRSLDSVYVRVVRDGKSCTRSFTDLTESEQQNYLATLDREGLERMCILMICVVYPLSEWRMRNARRKTEPGKHPPLQTG